VYSFTSHRFKYITIIHYEKTTYQDVI